MARRGEPADQRELGRPVGPRLGVHVAGHIGRRGLRPGERGGEGGIDVRLDLSLDGRDVRLRQHSGAKKSIELGQRIVRLLHSQPLLALVGLGILGGMPAQPGHGEPEQGGAIPGTNVGHRFLKQTGSVRRLGAIAISHQEIAERREVGRDVAAWRLEAGRDRDAVAVVLDIEEHRQREGRGDRQRRPEAIGRDGGLAAQHHRDRAVVAAVAQDVTMVGDALGPPDRRRVLGADVPRHREHDRAVRLRQVAHHADVPAVAEAARLSHGGRERVLQREAERQEHRPRAVVGADGIVRVVQQAAQDDLRHLVPASRELVEHLPFGDETGLLDVVQRPRGEAQVEHPPPVDRGVDARRRRAPALHSLPSGPTSCSRSVW